MKYKIGDLFIIKDRNKYQMSCRWVILSIDRRQYLIGLKNGTNEYLYLEWLYEYELENKFNYIEIIK